MEFSVSTQEQLQIIDITGKVIELAEGKVEEGMCLVYVPHATASLIINEHEPNLEQDFLRLFRELVPKSDYRHNQIDDNAEAHLKSGLFSPCVTIPISGGSLVMGTWQRIMLCEFDGPRSKRRVVVSVK